MLGHGGRILAKVVSMALAVTSAFSLSARVALADYAAYYARGESKTAKAKRHDLGHFSDWLESRIEEPVTAITTEDIREFLAARLAIDAPSTVSRRLATIRHAFNFLAAKHPGYYPPTKGVKGPTIQQATPRSFSSSEMLELERSVDDVLASEFKRRRLQTILALGRGAGLRVGEIHALRVGQIDVLTRTIIDLHRKAHRFQSLPLDDATMEALEDYLPVREEALREHDPMYIGRQNRSDYPLIVSAYAALPGDAASYRLSTKAIYLAVRKLGVTQGIKAHPHKLRHTFCREFLEACGKDIALTAEAAGHADINTTRLYLTQGIDRIREVQRTRKRLT